MLLLCCRAPPAAGSPLLVRWNRDEAAFAVTLNPSLTSPQVTSRPETLPSANPPHPTPSDRHAANKPAGDGGVTTAGDRVAPGGGTSAAAPAGADGVTRTFPRAIPKTLPVVCGTKRGSFMLAEQMVTCHCAECAEKEKVTGEQVVFAPVAYEKHGGLAAARKWKSSIRVELQVGTGLQLLGLRV